MRQEWSGPEDGEPVGQREGGGVQYSEKPFPVFVPTSSLISVMLRNWGEARKMKAPTSKRSAHNKKKKKKKHMEFISEVVYPMQIRPTYLGIFNFYLKAFK